MSESSLHHLLAKWQAGDEEGLRALFPVVYSELRRVAHYHLQKERPGHTLQSTARVMGISPATVKRDCNTARFWLHHEMSRQSEP